MRRFTDRMKKEHLVGKSLRQCRDYLATLGITKIDIIRNSKGHPVEIFFFLDGTDFQGYVSSVYFEKNTGICIG